MSIESKPDLRIEQRYKSPQDTGGTIEKQEGINSGKVEKHPMALMHWLGAIRNKYREVFGLAKQESRNVLAERLYEELEIASKEAVREGVDFSRCQMNKFVEDYKQGRRVEFESFSPYLSDYNTVTGEVWVDKLAASDKIGIEIAKVMRNKFPQAKMISLYDEYNTDMPDTTDARGVPLRDGPQMEFSLESKGRFRKDIEELLRRKGVLNGRDVEDKNYLFISESEKIKDAEELVARLEEKGYVRRDGQAIDFYNPSAENPVYQKITLRSKNGRWLCEALDASSYIKPENLAITHLVVLPDHFKQQQDKVWEVLRVLGIEPLNYHNIFFNEKEEPEKVARVIGQEIEKWL